MGEFAKLYGSGENQVLVKIDASEPDAKPEVRFYCSPTDMGVCSVAWIFDDTDEGWDKAEDAFAKVDWPRARQMITSLWERAADLSAPDVGHAEEGK